ncbi:hypothetical protein PybrP1_001767 [[Pythium] brassicae (nom. inval.)]|nr:hypothetical protein PybrP1_001767 [[Pythium] brassicae (nom. inval.)]
MSETRIEDKAPQPQPQTEEAAEAAAQSEQSDEEQAPPVHDITATTVSGSRVRRSTQKFTVAEPKADDVEAFTPPRGAGERLGDIAGVGDAVAGLNKKDAETLKALYLVMYARRFQLKNLKVIKEHILEFSGIPEPEQSPKARETLFGKVARWTRSFVLEVMDVLGVDRSKKSFDEEEKPFDKDALINRLIDWLYHPQAKKKSGLKAPTPKAKKAKQAEQAEKPKASAKRKSSAKDAVAKTTKKPKTTTTAAAAKKKKKETAAAAGTDENEGDDHEKDEKDDASEGGEGESDYEDDAKPAKKRAKRSAGASSGKATPTAKAGDDEADAAEGKADGGDDNADGATGEKRAALDADVQAKVKQIIEQGNAEELTVKTIVRQVSEELGRDLSAEKNAIKEFIRAGQ